MDEKRVIGGLDRLIEILLSEGVRGFVIISEAQLRELLGMVLLLGPKLDAVVQDILAHFAGGPDGAKGSFFINQASWNRFLRMAQWRLRAAQRLLNEGSASLDEESFKPLVAWIEAVYSSAEKPLTSIGEIMEEVREAVDAPAPGSSSKL